MGARSNPPASSAEAATSAFRCRGVRWPVEALELVPSRCNNVLTMTTSRDKLVQQPEVAWEAPTYVIEMEGVQIWVRRHHREQGQMLFYVAELAVAGQEDERAIVEAR